MIYKTAEDWLNAPQKRVVLFGMSGLGKTYLSNMLRDTGQWFHYSVDYRIGTRYMGELIADNAKAHAMQVPFLRELLMTDSIYIGSNITFDNLAPLSTYLGKPGDPAKGGLPFDAYRQRQTEHRGAEIAAMLDTERFAERAVSLYGYPHFVCDTSGSICEVVDPEDADDPVLGTLEDMALLVWLKGDEAHRDELVRRFDRAPKPMYYQPDFLSAAWDAYQAETGATEESVDPDAFVRWTYARALDHRQPRYEAMARRGVTVTADEVAKVTDAQSFDAMIAKALEAR
ncbi:ATPase [Pseudooceanicola onchidii]|uniref:ATPase n=1 Tax=Pseudooceanicola onchidii TaxID=2562279 RepID=UPI0010AB444A|nr:ATPase [Pseudooceanicola onchidii]